MKKMTSKRFIITLFLFELMASVIVMRVSPLHAQPANAPNSFADLAEQVSGAVVNISTTQQIESPLDGGAQNPYIPYPDFPPGSPFQDFFEEFFNAPMPRTGPAPKLQSLGSGFIIDAKNGYIVTNNHVVEKASEIKVTLQDDTSIDAELVGSDDKTDLAVLKVDPSVAKLTSVSWGDSDAMRVGDWVLAVGNPFGLGGTVTAGIISARQRNINAGPYDDFIQTDASINRGNSGGPMFNLAGDIIGINTAIFSPTGGSVGIGFAVPSALAKPVINQLIKYGQTRRGWLGVRIQTVTPDIAENLGLDRPRGALVASATLNGPAAKAGIQAGDVIVGFNDQDVNDMRRLPRIVADTEIGKSTDITIWRNGKTITKQVTVGQLEQAEENGLLTEAPRPGSNSLTNGSTIDLLGLDVTPMDARAQKMFDLSNDMAGLIVTAVKPDSSAAAKGISPGDVIVEVNQQKVTTIKSLTAELQAIKKSGKPSALLLINSRGNLRFVAVKLTSAK